jgi:hypothetical protein
MNFAMKKSVYPYNRYRYLFIDNLSEKMGHSAQNPKSPLPIAFSGQMAYNDCNDNYFQIGSVGACSLSMPKRYVKEWSLGMFRRTER